MPRIDIRIIVGIKLVMLALLAFMLLPAVGQVAAPQAQLIVPIDIVALVQAVFTGIAAIGGVFATIYSLVASARAKRAEHAGLTAIAAIGNVKENVAQIEHNTNAMTETIASMARKEGLHEGEAKGLAAGAVVARTLAEGQRQGVEAERSSVDAKVDPKPT